MGTSTREKGVLKLVHPGRHVECHRKPLTAAEIMRKNPGHCVARPEVFKYPWIVVRPDSLLMPGKVFYIVPNHTIHRLMKEQGCLDGPSSRHKESLDANDQVQGSIQTSPTKSSAGRTPKHRWLHNPESGACFEEQDSDWSCTELSRVKINRVSPVDSESSSSSKSKTFQAIDYYLNGRKKRTGSSLSITGSADQPDRSSRQFIKLKSCMREEGSIRKSLNLRVHFELSS